MTPGKLVLLRIGVLPFLFVTAAGVLGACEDESAGPEEGVSAEDVTDLEVVPGREVTVSAEVSDIFTANAFWIGGDDVGGDPLLVLSADAPRVDEGEVVRVTGIVRALGDAETFEDDFGFAWDPAYQDLAENEEYAVAASEIEVLDGNG